MTDQDNNTETSEFSFATRAVREGQVRTSENEHSEPIFPTSSYVFASAAEAAARFSGDQPGNIYSRFTNPTVRTFEQRLAAMEGGEACVATASGMAARSIPSPSVSCRSSSAAPRAWSNTTCRMRRPTAHRSCSGRALPPTTSTAR